MNSPVRRIMLADDHEAIRLGVRAMLSARETWNVVSEASEGWDALEQARMTRPDIAILDYSLPGLNGLELTRMLRKELPSLEVLMFTMHDREDVLAELLCAGVRGYVLKSDGATHLLSAVESLSLRRPYFSGNISETLLNRFLDGRSRGAVATGLTAREREIVQLIAEGLLNKQVAARLDVSVKTVETHRAAAMRKLGLKTTADLVRYAVRNAIVEA